MSQKSKTVIIIVGPTASGKTAYAIALAKHLNTSIISADSRQCYREITIGTAKPTKEELEQVPHYFINSHSIHDNVTAQTFETYSLNAVETIFKHSNYAVMAGGTGLYIKAFCEGLDTIPGIDPEIRAEVRADYTAKGLTWLQQHVQTHDAAFWAVAEQQNPQRLMRALEVKMQTGNSILYYQTREKKERPFNIVKLGIDISMEQLHTNIAVRSENMLKQGLVEEVAALLPYSEINAMQTVGYKEVVAFLKREVSLEQAIENIKINTRKYAKRQLTWFKKDDTIKWVTTQLIANKNDTFLSIFDK